MLEREIYDGDLPCIIKNNIDNTRCHVFSWGNHKNYENSMKIDNVEVFTKGECYTSHLIRGKKHEKYVNKGNNNICVGSANHYELDIVRLFYEIYVGNFLWTSGYSLELEWIGFNVSSEDSQSSICVQRASHVVNEGQLLPASLHWCHAVCWLDRTNRQRAILELNLEPNF